MDYQFTKEGSAEGSSTPRELFAEIIETLDPEDAVVISIARDGEGFSISATNGDIDHIHRMLAIALKMIESEDGCADLPLALQ